MLCQINLERWDECIPLVLLAYRTKVHVTTQYTPFGMMFGREMRNFNTRVETEAQEQQGQVGTSSVLKNIEIR